MCWFEYILCSRGEPQTSQIYLIERWRMVKSNYSHLEACPIAPKLFTEVFYLASRVVQQTEHSTDAR